MNYFFHGLWLCIASKKWLPNTRLPRFSGKGKTLKTIILEERDGWIGWEQRIFKAVKLIWMMLYMYIWHLHVLLHLSKPIECMIPTVKSYLSYGLWVLMMCQCRYNNCNQCTTVVEDVYNEEAMRVWGRGCREISYLLLNFAMNLKLL